ncbi:MAG TPA: hypothetical protein VJ935_01720 [Acidimicrobiia bacterium]|nr:hypothetical protein [Acidimicrobiia bacterium]
MKLLLLLLTAVGIWGCTMAQTGPWLDESGQRLEGSQLIQYQGFEECGHERVQFIVFFGAMYARDPEGVLGGLTNEAGEPLSFEVTTEIPEGVMPQGFTFRDREIYFDPGTREDYLYVYFENGNLERWPRAESPCDRPGS